MGFYVTHYDKITAVYARLLEFLGPALLLRSDAVASYLNQRQYSFQMKVVPPLAKSLAIVPDSRINTRPHCILSVAIHRSSVFWQWKQLCQRVQKPV